MGKRTTEPDDGRTFDFRKLRALRRAEDIAQRDLAALIGAHANAVLDWEHGRGIPVGVKQFWRMARVLGVRLDDLLEVHDKDGNPDKLRRR